MSWPTMIVFWVIWVVIAVAIAQAKNRSVRDAVMLTVPLGLIGVIIVACWKKIPAPDVWPAPGWYPDADGTGHRYWDGQCYR